MSKVIEIGIFAGILVLFLFVMKSAFGVGPTNNDTAYRNELVNYLHSHNMTINNTQLKANELMNINTLDISELQAVVNGQIFNSNRLKNTLLTLSLVAEA